MKKKKMELRVGEAGMFTFLHNQVSDDREKVKWTRWLSVSTTFVSVALVTLLELKLLSIAGFKKKIYIFMSSIAAISLSQSSFPSWIHVIAQ